MLNQTIGFPGGVQWDGKHVAVGDQSTPVVYQFSISRDQGLKVGSTPLGPPAHDVEQFFISGGTLITPNEYFTKSRTLSDVLFYKYPMGGAPTRTITKGQHFPDGVVVSLASRH